MKRFLPKALVLFLVLQAFTLVKPSSAHAEEMTCPAPVPVVLDVKPGDGVNKINLSSRGLLPVAVLSADRFDASQFTPEMAHLSDSSSQMGCEGASAIRWRYEDVNGDGRVDLVFFFGIQDLSLTSTTTAVTLMAHGGFEGTMIHITGTDSVVVKP